MTKVHKRSTEVALQASSGPELLLLLCGCMGTDTCRGSLPRPQLLVLQQCIEKHAAQPCMWGALLTTGVVCNPTA
jgi:hypothetical protein